MFRNFLIVGLRSLWRNKVYTALNVLGLTLGIATALVVFLLLREDLSYNKNIPNDDEVYRVIKEYMYSQGPEYFPDTSYPLADAMRADLPDVFVTQIHYHGSGIIKIAEKKVEVSEGVIFTDSVITDVLGLEWIAGDAKTAFSEPNKAVLTRELAETWYGSIEEAMGQTFMLDGISTLVVTGVIENWPQNTNMPIQVAVSISSLQPFADNLGSGNLESWTWSWSSSVWIRKNEVLPNEYLDPVFDRITNEHLDEKGASLTRYFLQPLAEVHFDQTYEEDTRGIVTSRSLIAVMMSIGVLILLIACINFINLATAQSLKRAHEVGVRKVLGGRKNHLTWQFLTETLIVTVFATVLALALVEISLTKMLEELQLNISLQYDLGLFIFLAIIILFTTFAAGAYPAFVLAGFKPVAALQSVLLNRKKGNTVSLRRGLVIFQFAVSQVLIATTLVFAAQVNFFQDKELGFRKDMVLVTGLPESDSAKIAQIRQDLSRYPETSNVAFASGPPTSNNIFNVDAWLPEQKETTTLTAELKIVDTSYKRLYGLEMAAGRWLNQSDLNSLNGYIVNETFVRLMGLNSPEEALGKMAAASISNQASRPIVGVVKDFHNKELDDPIGPCIFGNFESLFFQLSIAVAPGTEEKVRSILKTSWENMYPSSIHEARFLEEELAENYSSEAATYSLIRAFSLLALVIVIIGLYGLVAFMALQRTKEFGVRKVLGASTFSLMGLLVKEFNWLIVIAFVIATPLTFWLMNEWLSSFAYRINLNPLFFILPLIGTLLVTWLVAGWRAWWAAKQNPVVALRAE